MSVHNVAVYRELYANEWKDKSGNSSMWKHSSQSTVWDLQVSTNRQIILVRVEEIVQIIYRHH